MSNFFANIISGGKLSELEAEVCKLREENAQQCALLTQAKKEKDAVISELKAKISGLETSLNKETESKEHSLKETAKLNESFANAERTIEELQKRIIDLENSSQGVDEDSESLSMNEMQDKIEVLETQNSALAKDLENEKRSYADLQCKYSQIEADVDYYKKAIRDFKDETNKPKVISIPVTPYPDSPLSPDYVAGALKIDKVIDVTNDEEIDAREFFSKPVDEIFHIRRELQDAIILDRPKYVCKYCGQMVKISGRSTERGHASFFSHLYDSDACDLKTTTGLSKALINARKYGAFGESERHRQLKREIEHALTDLASIYKGITDVQQEKTVFGLHPLFKWRRPDVYLKYQDLEIVLEIQLSTTFASVIAERECFYKMNHIFIIWVFNFEGNREHVDLRNMMMKDIYFENHRNIFIIDEDTKEESLRRKELVMKCDWLESNGKWHYSGEDNYGTKGEFVTLSDLTYNTSTYKPYYHGQPVEQCC